MTKNQLNKMIELLHTLEHNLTEHKAPKSMVRRVQDAVMAVQWEIDRSK